LRTAFLLTAAFLLSAPADAAPRKPARQAGPAKTVPFSESSSDAPRMLNAYARCLANGRPGTAQDLLNLPLLSASQISTFKITITGKDSCSGSIPPAYVAKHADMVIGGMAEGLFLSRHARDNLADLIARSAGLTARNSAEEISVCLARRDSESVLALMRTAPGSNAEDAALQKLIPDLPNCVQAHTTLAFTKPLIRIYAAGGLYLVAEAPASGAVLR